VDTHSWLATDARGRGWGKQMRAAVLVLAFEHLGATAAVTEAWSDNAASLGVSRSLGYVDNGIDLHPREMRRMLLLNLVAPCSVSVEGVEPCLAMLGL
jgi:RimJ/RimL family protein N-acetyltransferase